MKRVRTIAGWVLLGGLGVLMTVSIVRSLLSQSPTIPRDAERRYAERVLVPEAGADTRVPLSPDGAVGGNGVIEPRTREVAVAPPVAGRIARIDVSEGQRVRQGDPLIALESAVEQAAVQAAEAEVATSRAELTRITKGSRYEDVRAARAEAAAAAARAELSEGVLERTRALVAGGAASTDDLDRARHTHLADKAEAAAARARRLAVINGSRPEDVTVAEARVQAAEARLAEARARVEQTMVRAPTSGEVLEVRVRAGEYAQPGGESVVTLGDTTAIRARIDVDERDVGKVHLGARAIVRANAYPGRDYEAQVVEIGRRMGRKNVRTDDPVERNDTKILEVLLAIPNPEGLIIGQRVMGYVQAQEPPDRSARAR